MKIRKTALAPLILLALILSLSGCGNKADTASAPGAESGASDASAGQIATADVDLTALSSTMVYAEVYNMVNAPEDYVGCTVKMRGSCTTFFDDVNDVDYYTCIIQDATACCATGIEFVLTEGQTYPDEMDEITVIGTFDVYNEGPYTYCTLRDATLLAWEPRQGTSQTSGDYYG